MKILVPLQDKTVESSGTVYICFKFHDMKILDKAEKKIYFTSIEKNFYFGSIEKHVSHNLSWTMKLLVPLQDKTVESSGTVYICFKCHDMKILDKAEKKIYFTSIEKNFYFGSIEKMF